MGDSCRLLYLCVPLEELVHSVVLSLFSSWQWSCFYSDMFCPLITSSPLLPHPGSHLFPNACPLETWEPENGPSLSRNIWNWWRCIKAQEKHSCFSKKIWVTKEPGLFTSKVFENARNSQNLRVIPATLLPPALETHGTVVHWSWWISFCLISSILKLLSSTFPSAQ